MTISYRLYDVFADEPFAGTPIAVVMADVLLDDAVKTRITAELGCSETVFVDPSNPASPFAVYNGQGKTSFGAHTTLAAAARAFELGYGKQAEGYSEYLLQDGGLSVNTFQDASGHGAGGLTLFARHFDFTTDRFVPELSDIARALNTEVKHLAYSRYKPRLVAVDTTRTVTKSNH